MDEQDPGLHFFPDGNVDLYGTLGVDKDATQDQIKKAYKKYVPLIPSSLHHLLADVFPLPWLLCLDWR